MNIEMVGSSMYFSTCIAKQFSLICEKLYRALGGSLLRSVLLRMDFIP